MRAVALLSVRIFPICLYSDSGYSGNADYYIGNRNEIFSLEDMEIKIRQLVILTTFLSTMLNMEIASLELKKGV